MKTLNIFLVLFLFSIFFFGCSKSEKSTEGSLTFRTSSNSNNSSNSSAEEKEEEEEFKKDFLFLKQKWEKKERSKNKRKKAEAVRLRKIVERIYWKKLDIPLVVIYYKFRFQNESYNKFLSRLDSIEIDGYHFSEGTKKFLIESAINNDHERVVSCIISFVYNPREVSTYSYRVAADRFQHNQSMYINMDGGTLSWYSH